MIKQLLILATILPLQLFGAFGDTTTLINVTWNTASGSTSTSFTSANINFSTSKIYKVTVTETSGNGTTLATENSSCTVGSGTDTISRTTGVSAPIAYNFIYTPTANATGNVLIQSGGNNSVAYPAHSGNLTVIEVDGSIDNLTAEITSLKAQIATLQAQATTDAATIASLQAQIAALQAAANNSKSNGSISQAQFDDVNNQLQDTKSKLASARKMLFGTAGALGLSAIGNGYLGYEKYKSMENSGGYPKLNTEKIQGRIPTKYQKK